MEPDPEDKVELISVDSIHVLNPRDRNRVKFREVTDSIASVGLKRPITVSRRRQSANGKSYDLVCGQGRLEAFKALGETHIPAIVTDLSEEDCFLHSLIENLARRQHSPLELLRDINTLSERGYRPSEIAAKTGLGRGYVDGILRLISQGEERLVAAVERDLIPVTTAIDIAAVSDEKAQEALTEAYERNELRGQKLQTALQVVKHRERWGKKLSKRKSSSRKPITAHAMVQAYKQESERQRMLIRKADLTESRLLLIVNAMKQLFADEHFLTLLRAEGLDTLPRQLAELIPKRGDPV